MPLKQLRWARNIHDLSTSKPIQPQTGGYRSINANLGRVSAHRCANIDRRLHPCRQVQIPRAVFDKMCGARFQMRVTDYTTRVLCLSMLVSRFPCSETNIRRTRRSSEKDKKALQFREKRGSARGTGEEMLLTYRMLGLRRAEWSFGKQRKVSQDKWPESAHRKAGCRTSNEDHSV